MTYFDDLLEKTGGKERSVRWFRDKIREMGEPPTRQLVAEGLITQRPQYGRMNFFYYDAKGKNELPYYDRFPLIFPINRAKGGILGINLHYLPPQLRAKLMDAIYDVANNERYDETTKVKLSYNILNGASRYKEFKPCVKHYLASQLRTRLVYVNPTEWDIALFLPTERFEKSSRSKVWQDSRKIIRGG